MTERERERDLKTLTSVENFKESFRSSLYLSHRRKLSKKCASIGGRGLETISLALICSDLIKSATIFILGKRNSSRNEKTPPMVLGSGYSKFQRENLRFSLFADLQELTKLKIKNEICKLLKRYSSR